MCYRADILTTTSGPDYLKLQRRDFLLSSRDMGGFLTTEDQSFSENLTYYVQTLISMGAILDWICPTYFDNNQPRPQLHDFTKWWSYLSLGDVIVWITFRDTQPDCSLYLHCFLTGTCPHLHRVPFPLFIPMTMSLRLVDGWVMNSVPVDDIVIIDCMVCSIKGL